MKLPMLLHARSLMMPNAKPPIILFISPNLTADTNIDYEYQIDQSARGYGFMWDDVPSNDTNEGELVFIVQGSSITDEVVFQAHRVLAILSEAARPAFWKVPNPTTEDGWSGERNILVMGPALLSSEY